MYMLLYENWVSQHILYISSYENTNLTSLPCAIGDRQKVSYVNKLLALNYT